MNPDRCPVCSELLEVRDVSPCMDCGAHPVEVQHALAGLHTYAEVRIFGDLRLVLCDFCQVDFGSYLPSYFGPSRRARVGYQHMDVVRPVEPFIGKDKYCPACGRRLAFLQFLVEARRLHGAG